MPEVGELSGWRYEASVITHKALSQMLHRPVNPLSEEESA